MAEAGPSLRYQNAVDAGIGAVFMNPFQHGDMRVAYLVLAAQIQGDAPTSDLWKASGETIFEYHGEPQTGCQPRCFVR